jgi:hypothetical protein
MTILKYFFSINYIFAIVHQKLTIASNLIVADSGRWQKQMHPEAAGPEPPQGALQEEEQMG